MRLMQEQQEEAVAVQQVFFVSPRSYSPADAVRAALRFAPCV